MATQLTEEKVRKVIREEITTFPALRMLNKRLDGLEDNLKSFQEEFGKFKNRNLSLLDAIYKLLKDNGQELLVTKHKVYDDHEPRISKLEDEQPSIVYP